jgi:hypothetical protein
MNSVFCEALIVFLLLINVCAETRDDIMVNMSYPYGAIPFPSIPSLPG